MTNEITELMPLILAGDGYQLTISDEAIARKASILAKSESVTSVTSNDDSASAQRHTRALAAMRIEVEKSRKLVKEPVNRIGKMIDAAAAEFMVEITAEAERAERAAFEAARAAREAAEEGGIAAVLAAKKAATEKMKASNEVASTKIANGVRFAWDFEGVDISQTFWEQPVLVDLTIRRADVLAYLKSKEGDDISVEDHAMSIGIRAFKKPIVSSR